MSSYVQPKEYDGHLRPLARIEQRLATIERLIHQIAPACRRCFGRGVVHVPYALTNNISGMTCSDCGGNGLGAMRS